MNKFLSFVLSVALIAVCGHAELCCIYPDPAPAPPDWWPPAHYHLPIIRTGPPPPPDSDIGESVTWEEITIYVPLIRS